MSDDETTGIKIAKIETALESVQATLLILSRQWETITSGNQETQKLFGRLEQLLNTQEAKNIQIQADLAKHERENDRCLDQLQEKVADLEINSAKEKATIYGVISGVRRTYAAICICMGIIMSLLTYIFNEKFDTVRDLQRQIVVLQIAARVPQPDRGKEH